VKKPKLSNAKRDATSDKISYGKASSYGDNLHKENILLLYDDGYTFDQIAAKFKLKIQTVKGIVLGYLERTA
jgi:DNA-binding NarL/FixJ family response regulator